MIVLKYTYYDYCNTWEHGITYCRNEEQLGSVAEKLRDKHKGNEYSFFVEKVHCANSLNRKEILDILRGDY